MSNKHNSEQPTDKKIDSHHEKTASTIGATELQSGAGTMSAIEAQRTNKSSGSAGGDGNISVQIGVAGRDNPLTEKDLIALEKRLGNISPDQLRLKAEQAHPAAIDLLKQMDEAAKLPQEECDRKLSKIQEMANNIFHSDRPHLSAETEKSDTVKHGADSGIASNQAGGKNEIFSTGNLETASLNNPALKTYTEVLKDLPPGAEREVIKQVATDLARGAFGSATSPVGSHTDRSNAAEAESPVSPNPADSVLLGEAAKDAFAHLEYFGKGPATKYLDDVVASGAAIDNRGRHVVMHFDTHGRLPDRIDVEDTPGHLTRFMKQADDTYKVVPPPSPTESWTLNPKTGDVVYEKRGDGKVSTYAQFTNAKGEIVRVNSWGDGEYLEQRFRPPAVPGGPEVRLGRVYHDPDGTVSEFIFAGGKPERMIIREPNGFVTDLKRDDKFSFAGQRKDARGHVVEEVTALQGFLVRRDIHSNKFTYLRKEDANATHRAPRYVEGGVSDTDRGELKQAVKGKSTVFNVLSRRMDEVSPAGDRKATIVAGRDALGNDLIDQSSVTAGGDVRIRHYDGSGLDMDTKYDVTIKSPPAADEVSKLSPAEIQFVNAHKGKVDLRDVAEIHRRFRNKPAELISFYQELTKLDGCKNLNPAEVDAVRSNMMHHVACPQEINQGSSDNCAPSVVQRYMAMSCPSKYAFFMTQILNNNQFELQDLSGTKVAMNVRNWAMDEHSGRDIATRIFDNAAIQIEAERGHLKVTTDVKGASTLTDAAGHRKEFRGLLDAHISDLQFKLTGEKCSMVKIRTPADLHNALRLANGKPITIGVLQGAPPFENQSGEHVVTITDFFPGPPPRVAVQNQYGSEMDHSTRDTLLDAQLVVDSMIRSKAQFDGVLNPLRAANGVALPPPGEGSAIVSIGDGASQYEFDAAGNAVPVPGSAAEVNFIRALPIDM
jgi:hypothetical protein